MGHEPLVFRVLVPVAYREEVGCLIFEGAVEVFGLFELGCASVDGAECLGAAERDFVWRYSQYRPWAKLAVRRLSPRLRKVPFTVPTMQLQELEVRVSPHLQAKEPPPRDSGEEGAWYGMQRVEIDIVDATEGSPQTQGQGGARRICHGG